MMDRLVELLQEKSTQLNLFSAGDRLKLADKHIPDSLAVLDFWLVQKGMKVLDIGTGGGLPGLALALKTPELTFRLVDAREKKVRAVQEVADDLGLENLKTVSERFEVLAHKAGYRKQYDVVTARAVAPLPVLLEYASGFLRIGGRLYAWKGPEYPEELKASAKAQHILGLVFEKAHAYVLPTGEERFILSFVQKKDLAPEYPRADGVPKARPLV
jgi:16S rRNA (guanine527-N7)-methyltransferase